MVIDLDWRSIAGVVAPFAPKLGTVLGTALGGPFGAIIGGLAGNAIAGAFGVEATPEAVGRAIAEDPKAGDKLARLEEERGQEIVAQAQIEVARLEQAGLTARANITEINTTLREEIAHGVSWWHWRHLLGYLVLLYGLVGVAGMAKVIFYPASGASAADLSALFNATTVFTGGIFALLGYVAADTTNRVNTAITGQHSAGGLMNTVRAAVTGGKK
jgi:hypothetical protein